jgi:hypothetical protein
MIKINIYQETKRVRVEGEGGYLSSPSHPTHTHTHTPNEKTNRKRKIMLDPIQITSVGLVRLNQLEQVRLIILNFSRTAGQKFLNKRTADVLTGNRPN